MHRFIITASRGDRKQDDSLRKWLFDSKKVCCHFSPTAHLAWHSLSCRIHFALWSSRSETGLTVEPSGRATGILGWAARTTNPTDSQVVGYEDLAASEKDPLTAQQSLDGIYCTFRLEPRDEGLVFRDPLGLYPLYYWSNGTVSLLSNSAWMIWSLANEALGLVIPCDEEATAALLLNGQMFGDATGFQGVRAVPAFHSIHLDAKGQMDLRATQGAFWSRDPARVSRAKDKDTAIQRMTGIGFAATNVSEVPRCELTGGRDSRMVLELLYLASVGTNVEFFTFGATNTLDSSHARCIAARIGAEHRNYQWPTIAGGNCLEGFIAHVERTAAQLGCWEISNAITDVDIVFSGLAGEGLRTNYPACVGLQTIDDVLRAFDRFEFGRYEYLRPGVKDQLKSRVRCFLLAPHEEGARPEDLFDIFYLEHRLRRWVSARPDRFGQYVLPLYSPAAIQYVMGLSSAERAGFPLHKAVSRRANLGLDDIPIQQGTSWKSTFSTSERPTGRLGEVADDAMGRSCRNYIRIMCNEQQDRTRAEAVLAAIEFDRKNPAFELLDREKLLSAATGYDKLDRRQRMEIHHALTVLLWLGLARP